MRNVGGTPVSKINHLADEWAGISAFKTLHECALDIASLREV